MAWWEIQSFKIACITKLSVSYYRHSSFFGPSDTAADRLAFIFRSSEIPDEAIF